MGCASCVSFNGHLHFGNSRNPRGTCRMAAGSLKDKVNSTDGTERFQTRLAQWFKNVIQEPNWFQPWFATHFFSPFSWNWNLLGSGVHRTIFLRIFQDWKARRECSKKRCLLSVPKWSIDEINEGRSISIYHVNGGHRSQIHHILTWTKTKYPLVNEQKSLIYRWRVVIFHDFPSLLFYIYPRVPIKPILYLISPYFPMESPLNHNKIIIFHRNHYRKSYFPIFPQYVSIFHGYT